MITVIIELMQSQTTAIFRMHQHFSDALIIITLLALITDPDLIYAQRTVRSVDGSWRKFLTPDDFIRAQETPVKKPTDREIEAIQNYGLFEGDIEGIDDPQMAFMHDQYDDSYYGDIFRLPFHSALNLATYPEKIWPEGIIPYEIEETMSKDERAAIAQAFDEYKQKTCIRFVPKTAYDFDFIYIKTNFASGCSSYVGRSGGNQTVSLEVGKCFTKGIIAHELMHALGFFHEHSRTDRDQFVEILEDNIRPGMLRNFEKYPRKIVDTLGMPYDYDSVMHYHKLAFSKNGKSTIVPRDGHAQIGQRYKLSIIDAKKINKLYRCSEREIPSYTTTTTSKVTLNTKKPQWSTTEVQTSTQLTRMTSRFKWTTTIPRKSTSKPDLFTTKITQTVCEDLNAHCEIWEQLGHCVHSEKYMAHYCRKSCKLCEVERTIEETTKRPNRCIDKNLFCGYWAKIGECKKSDSKFMKTFCKRSCGLCK